MQDELKLWDSHTQDGFVAGSTFTLAGISTPYAHMSPI